MQHNIESDFQTITTITVELVAAAGVVVVVVMERRCNSSEKFNIPWD